MSDDRPWHTFDGEGRCIAWLHSLPDGTRYLLADDGRSDARIAPTAPPMVNAFDRPVVVVAWPDGSPPEAPQPDALVSRLVAMVRLIDWRGQEVPLRNLLAECAGALEAASAIRQEVKS